MSHTLHDEIADILAEEILRGQYRAGERLPSERDLAVRFHANRGAVREAIKKLEQLRLADVQPGGARVRAVEESSLGVLGYLLTMNELPEPNLIEQIMDVMTALTTLATERALQHASDAEIEETHDLITRILNPDISKGELIQYRVDLAQRFMKMSGNLVLMLIGRSLHIQFMGKKSVMDDSFHSREELDQHLPYLRQLDDSLMRRDTTGAVSALKMLTQMNKAVILPALRAAHIAKTETETGPRRAAL